MGPIRHWVIPKTIKKVPIASLFGTQYSCLDMRGGRSLNDSRVRLTAPSGVDGPNGEDKFCILWDVTISGTLALTIPLVTCPGCSSIELVLENGCIFSVAIVNCFYLICLLH